MGTQFFFPERMKKIPHGASPIGQAPRGAG